MIINNDALSALKELPSESHDCCVTSPPYFNLRDYSCGEKEIGREKTIKEYITNLGDIFDEVKRTLKSKGTCWIVVGDSYGGKHASKESDYKSTKGGIGHTDSKIISPKSLLLIPQRLAIELSDREWLIRNLIVWHKPSCMPNSVKDRFTVDYEIIIFATKNKKYFFEQQFEPLKTTSVERLTRAVSPEHKNLHVPGQTPHGLHQARVNAKKWQNNQGNHQDALFGGMTNSFAHLLDTGRNMRTVWSINPQPFKGSHFATFPTKLVERCLKAGCPVGGKSLDPFAGSGTVGLVAKKLGMDFTGIELNPEYVKIAEARIG